MNQSLSRIENKQAAKNPLCVTSHNKLGSLASQSNNNINNKNNNSTSYNLNHTNNLHPQHRKTSFNNSIFKNDLARNENYNSNRTANNINFNFLNANVNTNTNAYSNSNSGYMMNYMFSSMAETNDKKQKSLLPSINTEQNLATETKRESLVSEDFLKNANDNKEIFLHSNFKEKNFASYNNNNHTNSVSTDIVSTSKKLTNADSNSRISISNAKTISLNNNNVNNISASVSDFTVKFHGENNLNNLPSHHSNISNVNNINTNNNTTVEIHQNSSVNFPQAQNPQPQDPSDIYNNITNITNINNANNININNINNNPNENTISNDNNNPIFSFNIPKGFYKKPVINTFNKKLMPIKLNNIKELGRLENSPLQKEAPANSQTGKNFERKTTTLSSVFPLLDKMKNNSNSSQNKDKLANSSNLVNKKFHKTNTRNSVSTSYNNQTLQNFNNSNNHLSCSYKHTNLNSEENEDIRKEILLEKLYNKVSNKNFYHFKRDFEEYLEICHSSGANPELDLLKNSYFNLFYLFYFSY